MTVRQLLESADSHELTEWMAFSEYEMQMRKEAGAGGGLNRP
jgi:hypothetical protein